MAGVDAVIVGVGARTHVAMTALQSTMAIRALKMQPTEGHILTARGQPIAMCRLRSISDATVGFDRFLALAAPALRQSIVHFRHRLRSLAGLPLVLALPSRDRPGVTARLVREFHAALASEVGVELDARHVAVVSKGRAGGAEAFAIALDWLSQPGVEAVLVGGVDSYFDPDVLEWLDDELRLHSDGTIENGFIPGEGAAFVLLTQGHRASGATTYGRVRAAAVAIGLVPTVPMTPAWASAWAQPWPRPLSPEGRRRLRHVGAHRRQQRAPPHHRWTRATAKVHKAFAPKVKHEQATLYTGDIGAATAPLLAVHAGILWSTAAGDGNHALIAVHSDGAERGAVLLEGQAA